MVSFTGTITPVVTPAVFRARSKKYRSNLQRAFNARCPYLLLVELEETKGKYIFGQFSSAFRAHAEGRKAMDAVRVEDLPHRKKCVGYTVQNILNYVIVDEKGEPV